MPGDPLKEAAKAIKDKWDGTPAISAAVPGGLHEGPKDAPATSPYATLTVKQGPRPNEYASGGDWLDYEEATITIYGIGLVTIGDAVSTCKAGLEAGSLTIQNGAFMRLEVLPGWTNERDDKKQGQDWRKAVLRYCVWAHRAP